MLNKEPYTIKPFTEQMLRELWESLNNAPRKNFRDDICGSHEFIEELNKLIECYAKEIQSK